VGRPATFQESLKRPVDWTLVRDSKVSLTQPVHLAFRRIGNACMLRRTDDFSVVIVEASGQRRYFLYDLREDINLNLLRVGRKFGLVIQTDWDALFPAVTFPENSTRHYIGW
jgi:hypothetical protein